MKTQTLNAADVKTVLGMTNGSFFSVLFTKKNGELRRLNGRTGVTCHLVSDENRKREATECPKDIVRVFDAQANAYRSFNVDSVINLTVMGTKFEIK
jgi:hypothetical protein